MSVRLPFAIKGVNPEQRLDNMDECIRHDFPRLQKVPFHDERLTLVCYGPSLRRTWHLVRHPFMTVSGAHDFMLHRGMKPDYHVDCDPREHKATFTARPAAGVKYLMASCMHPQAWRNLAGMDVTIWHEHEGDETAAWQAANDPKAELIGGGTTVGMRALEIGARLGYRRYKIHGMDCSYVTDATHAGEHPTKNQMRGRVRCGTRGFETTPQLYSAAEEMLKFISTYDVEVEFFGDGLLQAMVKEYERNIMRLSAKRSAHA